MNRTLSLDTSNQLELFQAKEIVRPDINIGKWAGIIFSSPWARDLHESKKIIISTGSDRVEASITITPAIGRKRPTATSQKVFYALIQIWEESGKPANGQFSFSARQLASILDWKWSGKDSANRIQEHLSILNSSEIDWERSFVSDDVKNTIKEQMNLIDAKAYLKREKMIDKEFFYGQHNVRLNFDLVQNMLNGKTKPFNYRAYISIKNETASTLYNLLDNFLSSKLKWERRSVALLKEDLELVGKRYEKRFARHAKLKEFVKELDGKELSSGKLSLAIEKTADGEDYKLVARKTPHIQKSRRSKKLANPKDDIPFIVEDILEGLGQIGSVRGATHGVLEYMAMWYSRQMLFDALAIVKADLRGNIKTQPIKAYVYQVHVMAHERGKEWIKPCGKDCKHRPENRKKLFN